MIGRLELIMVAALGAALPACGAREPATGGLTVQMDSLYIATIPVDERGAVDRAREAVDAARIALEQVGLRYRDATQALARATDQRDRNPADCRAGLEVAWRAAETAHARAHMRAVEAASYARLAELELAKVRLAMSRSIYPRGASLADFERQAASRARHEQITRTAAEQARRDADHARLRREQGQCSST